MSTARCKHVCVFQYYINMSAKQIPPGPHARLTCAIALFIFARFPAYVRGYKDDMPQANWVIVLHIIILWGSVFAGLTAGWRLPFSYVVAIPLGLIIWGAGLLYNLYNIQRFRRRPARHQAELNRRVYQRIVARTMMNLGIGLATRSLLTIIAAVVLIPIYIVAANKRRQYLDYLRSGMQSDVFPDRIAKR
jgi:MFS family permease